MGVIRHYLNWDERRMLTGKALGDAIAIAIKKKGVYKADVAKEFGIKPPSVTDWVKYGHIDKKHLPHLVAYFSDVVGPEHWGLPKEWGRQPELEVVGGVEEWGPDTPLEPDEIELPYLDETELAAGGGMVAEAIDRGRRLRFAPPGLPQKNKALPLYKS